MELIYELAAYLDIPNELISIEKVCDNIVWFRTTTGARYTCLTVRNGRRLKKNSVRPDFT
ncbi:MAG: hypothetical protein KAY59_07910 [Acidobacteria bacterium]|nr:hypothetical protein [Acidobacteriota bacterium]